MNFWLIVTVMTLLVFTTTLIFFTDNDNKPTEEEQSKYIVEGMNCFANGILCKNISCDLSGGCSAKDCVGGSEQYGALKIKCINISRYN